MGIEPATFSLLFYLHVYLKSLPSLSQVSVS